MQIYADNAATTKMSEAAIEAMTEGMRNWWVIRRACTPSVRRRRKS